MNSPSNTLVSRLLAIPITIYLAIGCVIYCVVRLAELQSVVSFVSVGSALWMEITAWIATIVGVQLLSNNDERFADMLGRLADRGVLGVNTDQLGQLQLWLRRKANRYALIFGILPPIVLLAVYHFVFNVFANSLSTNTRADTISLVIAIALEMVAAFVVGSYLGRVLCYSQFGFYLSQTTLQLNVLPGHPDGAAGLRPIGQYFFRNAFTAMLPVALLSFWCALIALRPEMVALEYRAIYLGLLGFAIGVEIIVFLVPLRYFRNIMVDYKQLNRQQSDQIGRNIVALRERVVRQTDTTELINEATVLAQLNQTYTAYTQMPTWPFDRGILRTFCFANFILILPFVIAITIG